jgi:hypothetical protein
MSSFQEPLKLGTHDSLLVLVHAFESGIADLASLVETAEQNLA